MGKMKKTRLQLSALVTEELKNRSVDIETVPFAIVIAAQFTPDDANWAVSFLRTTASTAPPNDLLQPIEELQSKFDCIWPG